MQVNLATSLALAVLMLSACSNESQPQKPVRLSNFNIEMIASEICASVDGANPGAPPMSAPRWEMEADAGGPITDSDALAIANEAGSECPNLISGYDPSTSQQESVKRKEQQDGVLPIG
jgi:hypothetical protein